MQPNQISIKIRRARSKQNHHVDRDTFIGQACDEAAAVTAARLMRHQTRTSRRATTRPGQTVSDYRRPVGLNCVPRPTANMRRDGATNLKRTAMSRGLCIFVHIFVTIYPRGFCPGDFVRIPRYDRTTTRARTKIPAVALNFDLLTSKLVHKLQVS